MADRRPGRRFAQRLRRPEGAVVVTVEVSRAERGVGEEVRLASSVLGWQGDGRGLRPTRVAVVTLAAARRRMQPWDLALVWDGDVHRARAASRPSAIARAAAALWRVADDRPWWPVGGPVPLEAPS